MKTILLKVLISKAKNSLGLLIQGLLGLNLVLVFMIKSVSWSALRFDLGSSCIGLLEVGKDEMFGPVLRPGF